MSRDLERITFNLIPKASKSLRETSALTGDNKTDVLNRAVIVYGYIEKILNDGGTFLVQETPDAVPEKLRLL